MTKKKSIMKMWIGILAVVMIVGFGFYGTVYGKDDNDPHKTGLPEFTPEELQYQNTHHLRVKNVKLNKLGLTRVNEARKAKGLNKLSGDEAVVVDLGQEIEGTVGAAPAPEGETGELPSALPAAVDNSTLKFFPPIASQGSFGSCGVYNGTYYAMTYMYAMARDLDAKGGGAAYRFSPKWTYNMVNNGDYNQGSWYYWAYEIGQKHGCATMAEFPYSGSTSDPSNYRAWCMDKTVWRDAIDRRFDQFGYVYATDTDAGINSLKQMLVNGYILNIPTYIYSWQTKAIGNDPSTAADDSFVGKTCTYWVNGTSGYHAMTLVGYNDDIWVDVNGNGAVDSGEKGAFRIANSWGTGWGEAGFRWMAYDALKNPSAVSGGPSANRVTGFSPSRAHWVTARSSYQPTMVAEFTLNHLVRNQLRMSLGLSDLTRTTPSTTWASVMINNSKYSSGPYAFNGTTTAVDGTFVLDFTDIAPAGATTQYRYYVGMYDNASGSLATLSSFTLIDVLNGNIGTVCNTVPYFADASQAYAYVDYIYSNGNIKPVAVASASPLSGQAPLLVNFDSAGSDDLDGDIVSWSWNFGDGTNGSGSTTNHTYSAVGTYTATLTVTDNMGASDQDSVEITVSPAPIKPVAVATASPTSGQAPLPVQFNGSTSYDSDGSVVSYSWNFGDGTSSTDVAVNHTYTAAGTYTATLTVTDNTGASDQDSVVITVSPAPTKVVYVADIAMSYASVKGGKTAKAVVTITDGSNLVSGATVTGSWSGVVTGTASVKTGADGKATFVSKKTTKKGVATFRVTGVTATGYTYNAGMNNETSDSVTLP